MGQNLGKSEHGAFGGMQLTDKKGNKLPSQTGMGAQYSPKEAALVGTTAAAAAACVAMPTSCYDGAKVVAGAAAAAAATGGITPKGKPGVGATGSNDVPMDKDGNCFYMGSDGVCRTGPSKATECISGSPWAAVGMCGDEYRINFADSKPFDACKYWGKQGQSADLLSRLLGVNVELVPGITNDTIVTGGFVALGVMSYSTLSRRVNRVVLPAVSVGALVFAYRAMVGAASLTAEPECAKEQARLVEAFANASEFGKELNEAERGDWPAIVQKYVDKAASAEELALWRSQVCELKEMGEIGDSELNYYLQAFKIMDTSLYKDTPAQHDGPTKPSLPAPNLAKPQCELLKKQLQTIISLPNFADIKKNPQFEEQFGKLAKQCGMKL